MARLRTRMSKIKEVLRLKFDCHLPCYRDTRPESDLFNKAFISL